MSNIIHGMLNPLVLLDVFQIHLDSLVSTFNPQYIHRTKTNRDTPTHTSEDHEYLVGWLSPQHTERDIQRDATYWKPRAVHVGSNQVYLIYWCVSVFVYQLKNVTG
jgi:hypothetical protein